MALLRKRCVNSLHVSVITDDVRILACFQRMIRFIHEFFHTRAYILTHIEKANWNSVRALSALITWLVTADRAV
jgi:hypothetical protein